MRPAAFVILSLSISVSCRSLPRPPYALAFALEGGSPRALGVSKEITVPLTITNTGQRTWDPARVHVSYHWLWLVPRELASRSRWDVPYHDGIRTNLVGPVAPGSQVGVLGRLLAPALPGLYWLEWDMVEEGVTWFGQVSPRQARRLVLVAPRLGDLSAPLPLTILLVAIVIGRKKRARPPGYAMARHVWTAPLATIDVWWSAASLLAKPLVLYQEALLEPTPVGYWLTAVVAVGVPMLALVLLPPRVRRVFLLALGILGTLVIVADILYYRFFTDVLSTPAVFGVHQTARVWQTIRSLFSIGLLPLVVDLPVAVWMIGRLGRQDIGLTLRTRVTALAVALAGLGVGAVALSTFRTPAWTESELAFSNRGAVEELSAFGFHAYDTAKYLHTVLLRSPATAAEMERARAWFADRQRLRAGGGPLFGVARGRSLIVIQVESLQDFVVDFQVGGQKIMPYLHRWSADGVRFTNVTDQTSEGRTADAEFASLVSLLPIEQGAVAFRFPGNHYIGLPQVLRERGYATLSAVAFDPGFWNRDVVHPAYGFDRSLFEGDFALTDQIGWGLNDRDFLQQMISRLEALPRPFCAWLITLSLHHPFDDFPDRHKVLKLGALERTAFGNYLHAMRFFDAALDQFKAALAARRLLDDVVLVVFGDHDAGFPFDPAMAQVLGIGADMPAWMLADRIPFFVCLPGAPEAALHGERSRPAGQTDFAPTLLALLGIDPAALPYVGRNLFGEPDDPPVLRPYGNWLDTRHLFITDGGNRTRRCYDVVARGLDEADACRDQNEQAQHERQISRLVVTKDLQLRLRDQLSTR